MIRTTLALIGLALCVPMAPIASGQEPSAVPDPQGLRAIINGPADIAVGRTIVLDASLSRVGGERVEYNWYVGDSLQPISRAVEALYTPEQPGPIVFRLVIRALVAGEVRTLEAQPHTVVAYSRKIVLVADSSAPADKVEAYRQAAEDSGIYLQVLQPSAFTLPFAAEEALGSYLSERSKTFIGASAVALWTDGISGLQSLMQVATQNPDVAASFKNQTLIIITDRGFQSVARTTQGAFSALQPRQIVVTRERALGPLLSSQITSTFINDLNREGVDHLVIDSSSFHFRPWNALSFLVNYMLRQGIPSQIVILLLVLPVIATILAFFKQVIGITTFGLYTPSIVALSFLALGWKVGVLFLLFIIVTGYATRALVRRLRLLYIPKVAIILTVVSITLLLLLAAGAYFGVTFSRDTVFILLIMSTLAESFLNLKREEGLYSAVLGIGETVMASLLCVALVQWPVFQSLLLAYPELILLTLAFNMLLGRWTGLRLLEYWRFREVFRHLQEE